MALLIVLIRCTLEVLVTGFLMTALWIHGLFVGHTAELGFRYRALWARWSAVVFGIKVETLSSSNHLPSGSLIVSNHRSLTDPIVQLAHYHAFVIAKNEVGSIPVIGKGAEMTGIVLVKRDKSKSRLEARSRTSDILKNGQNVLVYPEGTTTADPKTGSFKIGTFKVAVETGASIIPAAIEYRDEKDLWTHEGIGAQLLRQLGAWRTYVRIRTGEPIRGADAQQLKKKTQDWIDDNLKNMQKDWSTIY